MANENQKLFFRITSGDPGRDGDPPKKPAQEFQNDYINPGNRTSHFTVRTWHKGRWSGERHKACKETLPGTELLFTRLHGPQKWTKPVRNGEQIVNRY